MPLLESPTGKNYNLPNREDTRPDVFVLNNAAAYTAWYSVRSLL